MSEQRPCSASTGALPCTLCAHNPLGGKDGFRIVVSGPGKQEFRPDNLIYTFDDKLSLSGLFLRMDNFLGKGLDESMEKFGEKCRQEKAELATVQDALGKEFPQKAELALARENNNAASGGGKK